MKTDIFQDQVFVFTPKGEIKDLPAGATPLDFAYRIHTDLGHRCVGAKVNGRLVPLNYQLKNGDVVEILTSKSSKGPVARLAEPEPGLRAHEPRPREGPAVVQAAGARREHRPRQGDGREGAARGWAPACPRCRPSCSACSSSTTGRLLPARGLRRHQHSAIADQAGAVAASGGGGGSRASSRRRARATYTTSIRVLGTGDLLTRIARCCNPVPGDAIIGYVTRGEGVTVHRRDCPNVMNRTRRSASSTSSGGGAASCTRSRCTSRPGTAWACCATSAPWCAEERVNMVGVHTQEHDDGHITIFVTLETRHRAAHRLLDKLEGVRGVDSVGRRLENAPKKG